MESSSLIRLRQCPRCKRVEEDDKEDLTFCSDCGEKLRDQVVVSDRYRLKAELGRGTFGTVFDAVDEKLNRDVALKLLNSIRGANQQFKAEVEALVKINSDANVVTVFEAGEMQPGDRPFIVMEKLEGETLEVYRKRQPGGRLRPEQAIYYIYQAASGIAAAHEVGVIHRDLSPHNIFVCSYGKKGKQRIKVLDFGIALLKTDESALNKAGLAGTPGFIAPELNAGSLPSTRSDIYSLGAVLFLLLDGNPPPSEGVKDRIDLLISRLRRQQIVLSSGLEKLLREMLAEQPLDRPQDGPQLVELIERLPERNPTPLPQVPANRGRRLLWGLGLAALLAVGVGLWLYQISRAPAEATARALALVQKGLSAKDPESRRRAVHALSQTRDPKRSGAVESRLRDSSALVAMEAIRGLVLMRAAGAIEALRDLRSQTKELNLAVQASLALHQLGAPDGESWLTERLAKPSSPEKRLAALALLELPADNPGAAEYVHLVLSKAPALDKVTIEPLYVLTKHNDEWAHVQLQQLRTTPPAGVDPLKLAFLLARNLDPDARTVLNHVADNPAADPLERLKASRWLVELGDLHACPLLAQTAERRDAGDALSELAVDGLLYCNDRQLVPLLDKLVQNTALSLALRLRASAAVLRLAIGMDAHAAAQLLQQIDASSELNDFALDSDRLELYPTASSPEEEGHALENATPAVRERVVRHGRWILDRVLPTLDTASSSHARIGAIMTVTRIGRTLQAAGSRDADGQILAKLRPLRKSSDPATRSAATLALYLLGDQTQRIGAYQGLHSADVFVRRLSIESLALSAGELGKLLGDPDPGIRFITARRLAGQHPQEAIPVLRSLIALGGGYGLLAFGLLRQLGSPVAYPRDLMTVLNSGSLPDRLAVVELSTDLGDAEGLPLLRRAMTDPAAVIRRRVIERCALFLNRGAGVSFRHIIELLVHDEEEFIRVHAQQTLDLLDATPPAVPTPPDGGPPDLPPPPGPKDGYLIIQIKPHVRVLVDGTAPKSLEKPLRLAPGKHQVSYLLGQKEVVIAPETLQTLEIPVLALQQALWEAKQALATGKLKVAAVALNQAQAWSKSAADKNTLAEYLFLQASLHDRTGQRLEALQYYVEYRELAEKGAYSEALAAAGKAIERLRHDFAEIDIFRLVDGQCRVAERKIVKPVPQTRDIVDAKGMTRRIQRLFLPGEIVEFKDLCKQ